MEGFPWFFLLLLHSISDGISCLISMNIHINIQLLVFALNTAFQQSAQQNLQFAKYNLRLTPDFSIITPSLKERKLNNY